MKKLAVVAGAIAFATSCHDPADFSHIQVHGDALRSIIEDQRVRDSYSEMDCYTQKDLDDLKLKDGPRKVAAALERNDQFRKAVDKVRAMPLGERGSYLRQCRLPLRRTWREIGRVSSEGTTDAGREAELLIAGTITDAAERLLSR